MRFYHTIKKWCKDETSSAISPEAGLYVFLGVMIGIAVLYLVRNNLLKTGLLDMFSETKNFK